MTARNLESYWFEFILCFIPCLVTWLGLFGRKGLLHARWKEVIAVSVTSGFVAFLFYLMLRGLAPHLGVAPGQWMILPAVVVVLWLYHDMMFLRRRR